MVLPNIHFGNWSSSAYIEEEEEEEEELEQGGGSEFASACRVEDSRSSRMGREEDSHSVHKGRDCRLEEEAKLSCFAELGNKLATNWLEPVTLELEQGQPLDEGKP